MKKILITILLMLVLVVALGARAEARPLSTGWVSIFEDDFESGDLSAWDAYSHSLVSTLTVDDFWSCPINDLLYCGRAISDPFEGNAYAHVTDNSPSSEVGYSATWMMYLTTDSTASNPARIFVGRESGNLAIFAVEVYGNEVLNNYYIRVSCRNNSNGWINSDWLLIPDWEPVTYNASYINVIWKAGSPGICTLILDDIDGGGVIFSEFNIYNSNHRLNTILWGITSVPDGKYVYHAGDLFKSNKFIP